MKNVVVLGSGRSGSSLLAGLMNKTHWHGDNLIPPSPANPKGFFEDSTVNHEINEGILKQTTQRQVPRGHWWLKRLAPGTPLYSTYQQRVLIRKYLQPRPKPFCLKDPRLSYTFPTWDAYLPSNTVVLVVFRNPGITVSSMRQEIRKAKYLANYKHDASYLFGVWEDMYLNILNHYADSTRPWKFISFDEILTKAGIEKVVDAVIADVDRKFPDVKLKRSKPMRYPENLLPLYNKLQELSKK